jgi:CheY-like chemotaxis protein
MSQIQQNSTSPGLPPELVHPENRVELCGQDLGHLFARIMIVDDEPINIKIVNKYLRGAGYRHFIPVTDSTTATQLIETEEPDIILLDYMMPKVNGLDILRWVRAHEEFQHIPVVMLTASTDSETKLAALESPCRIFFTAGARGAVPHRGIGDVAVSRVSMFGTGR